ncbi:MAG: HAD family hydrolase [Methanosphaera stadtmanae]|jgi:phosphoglycolate phosphatase|nr:HAD family hydrolase [Methanosphaera stadtmanae]
MKKICIFDFDGTLFNTIEDVAECLNKTLKFYGLNTFTLEQYQQKVGGNLYEILENLIGEENSNPETLEKFKDTYLEIAQKHDYTKTHPYEGMHQLLEKLQDNDIKLAVNSNRIPQSINHYLKEYMDNIEFIDIQGHVLTNPSKPDPYGVNHILKTANLDVEEAIYIGDSSTDVLTAKNAGIDVVLVSWGYSKPEDLKNQYITAVADTPDELYEIIN